MKTIASLGEFGWLKSLLPRLYWPETLKSQLCIGPGDDAGALRLSPGKVLVSTTDAMAEGIHFERGWFSWKDLGYKVMAVNLSDLAAMGHVKPLAALVSAAIPGDTPVDNVDKFYQGMHNCAQRWKTGFLGGDTIGSRKDWFVSVTLFGEASPHQLIKRRGARAGDFIVTSGPLGLAGAGLEVLRSRRMGLRWTRPLVEAFCRPRPRFDVGTYLGRTGSATSLIDSSDGLEASVRLLAESSRLGAEIDVEKLPVPRALAKWAQAQSRTAWSYALRGGEDYELIFTVRPARWEQARKRLPGCTVIGRMLPEQRGVVAIERGKRMALKEYGFAHFK